MKFLKFFLIFIVFAQSNSMQLDCEYKFSDRYYQCTAKVNLQVDSDQNKVSGVSQNHLQGRKNSDVKVLYIKRQNLTKFPRGIEKFFPNLEEIYAENNNIKNITKYDLNFSELTTINFEDNEIMTLDDDLFSFTPNLRWIRFRSNNIKHVGLNTFKYLTIDYLDFKNNGKTGKDHCLNEYAESHKNVEVLISKLPESCPPTNEMLIKGIWNSQQIMEKEFRRFENLESKFDELKSQMETNLDTLKVQIENLVKKMDNNH